MESLEKTEILEILADMHKQAKNHGDVQHKTIFNMPITCKQVKDIDRIFGYRMVWSINNVSTSRYHVRRILFEHLNAISFET